MGKFCTGNGSEPQKVYGWGSRGSVAKLLGSIYALDWLCMALMWVPLATMVLDTLGFWYFYDHITRELGLFNKNRGSRADLFDDVKAEHVCADAIYKILITVTGCMSCWPTMIKDMARTNFYVAYILIPVCAGRLVWVREGGVNGAICSVLTVLLYILGMSRFREQHNITEASSHQ